MLHCSISTALPVICKSRIDQGESKIGGQALIVFDYRQKWLCAFLAFDKIAQKSPEVMSQKIPHAFVYDDAQS